MLRKVLIVEDDSVNRAILANILRSEYEILEASNGKEALDILHRKYKFISAVILDLIMPVMDGFSLLAEIRDNAVLSQLPIIVATSATDEDSEVRAITLGANDFVKKPYNPALILHCLRNAINLRETASIVNALQRDKMTGLYNREAFFDKVDHMIKEHEPGYYTMFCFDIDNFKVINDRYGAAVGDRILKYIGKTVSEAISGSDSIAGRIAADNFAFIYPTGDGVNNIVPGLMNARYPGIGTNEKYTISEGRYKATDLSLSAGSIYDRAYIAKRSVKGRYDKHLAYFDETMRDRLIREQEIINEMGAALAGRQFEVWFQPQFNHSTGALIGAEALVRWRHPRKGIIPPDDFIPVFEQNGFIYELDKFVWEESCRYLKKWTDEGMKPLPVAVNISRYDIFRADFIQCITGFTEKYGIPVGLLRLEITESAFAKSTEQIIEAVEQLMSIGFTVEIDDFGSGYSSFNTLKDVPANLLKIDMRFLESGRNNQRGGNILESIVRMAKWIDMAVIAEGVETVEQADFLKSIGCNYVQGYLYATPMSAEDYEEMLASTEKEERLLKLETVENLNNNTFWDPKSMDTLIFNSYIGGACIFEYHNGRFELLRANDKYIHMLGIEGVTVEDVVKLDWNEYLNSRNKRVIIAALGSSMQTNEEVTEEIVFLGLPGCQRETHIRSTMRVIAFTDDRCLVYCTNENITAQRRAEYKEKQAAAQLRAIMDNINGGVTATIIVNGVPRILFANDKYYEQLGYTESQYRKEVVNPHNLICEEDRERVSAETIAASAAKKPFTSVYRIIRRDGTEAWIRNSISITKFQDVDEPVQLAVANDITAEMKADRKLREMDEQLLFLNNIAHDLLAQPDTDKGIEEVLRKLLEYFGGSRVYIFELDNEKRTTSNTFEVCAPGIDSEKGLLQGISFDTIPFWLHAFDNKSYVQIDSIDGLGDDRPEKQILLDQGISSLIAVPLKRDGVIIGFIGVDDPTRQKKNAARLDALGDYIAVMLTRRDLNKKINNDNKTLISLMNDIPGGFVRMRVYDDGVIVPVYMNDGFCRIVNMSHEEAMELYRNDALSGVYPDDVAIVRSAVATMLEKGEAYSSKYRLKNGLGGYKWLMIYGRTIKNDDGETYLNIFYTDVSGQSKSDEQRNELLDNIPNGAAIFELDGDDISVVFLNKKYKELIGLGTDDYSGKKAGTTIHPDDREPMMREIYLAIKENRDINLRLRIWHRDYGYRLFNVTARAVQRKDGTYSLYAIYSQSNTENTSYQNILSPALAVIMKSSSDIAFVKDRDFRYISCSRAFIKELGVDDESEVIGKTDYELVEKEYADRYREVETEIIREGTARLNYEEMIPEKDGGIRYSATSKYPLTDSNGYVIGIYSVTRDISAYRSSFEQLKLLTDTMPGGIAEIELDGEGLRITYFNDGFYEYSGYSRDEYAELSAADPLFIVFEEGKVNITDMIRRLITENAGTESCNYRCHTKGGGYRWFNLKCMVSCKKGDTYIGNAVLFDITEQKEAEKRLAMSEEQFRIAAALSGRSVGRYNIKTGVYYNNDNKTLHSHGFGDEIENVPQAFIDAGLVEPQSEASFMELHNKIISGEMSASAVVRLYVGGNKLRWFKLDATTILDVDNHPSEAIIVSYDVTEQLEKEAVYKKWQQSMDEKPPESYTLFRCNLSKNSYFEPSAGSLLKINFSNDKLSFNDRTVEYVSKFVFPEDRQAYKNLLNSDTLLANYYRGTRSYAMDYREMTPDDGFRWLHLSVELVEYPNSNDVEAYMMYENIDAAKQAELQARELAETDPLTGILNRAAFTQKMNRRIKERKEGSLYALLMFDIDGFKLVNDNFGHATGDRTLIDIAKILRSILRGDDLIGRLGGDEFVVCLCDIPGRDVIGRRARQICDSVRRSFNAEVQMSASLGIAVSPDDGDSFEALYRKADVALYHVKASGKDNYEFYTDLMETEGKSPVESVRASDGKSEYRRRMLIVEDNKMNSELLVHVFENDYITDTAYNGREALIKLRRYGIGTSVVLLDLIMPGLDGFAVLEKMKRRPETRSIPVIVVSGTNDHEAALKAVRCGAADFVTKPVDPDLLRIRVESAVSKAENERLRAQNNILMSQNFEMMKCRAAMEREGMAFAEYNTDKNTYEYDKSMAELIPAAFNRRPLSKLLVSDGVADAEDAEKLNELILEAKNNGDAVHECLIPLRLSGTDRGIFSVRAFRYGTDRIMLIFKNTSRKSDG